MQTLAEQYPFTMREIEKEDKQAEKFAQDMCFCLMKPIIVMDPGWCTPENLIQDIKIHRLLQNAKGETDIATDIEALAYLSNASLVKRPDHNFARIYMYLFKKVYPAESEDVDLLDRHYDSLDSYQERLLNDLKVWIWDKQVKAWKDKQKEQKKLEQTGGKV